jgi:glyoxylase-like metal-dependent hydrolase (beta-lactamase superfamily II)
MENDRNNAPFTRRRAHPLALAALILGSGCAPTSHPVTTSPLGTTKSSADLEQSIDQPGSLSVTQVKSADWGIDLSGLLNVKHPKAVAAGIKDRVEPIAIYFYAIKHPTRGLFLVDSGIEQQLRDDPTKSHVSWLVRKAMHLERLQVREDLRSFVERAGEPVQGLLLTHLHLDHVSGLPDLPNEVPVYVGPGEVQHRQFMNVFGHSTIGAELEGKGPLREFAFKPDPSGSFAGVLDVFGDGQLWALLVPGHTTGSMAFVARTTTGPVLITGDACHTAWGWNNGVEPGEFSEDKPRSVTSLAQLRALAAKHPQMRVYLGHQSL